MACVGQAPPPCHCRPAGLYVKRPPPATPTAGPEPRRASTSNPFPPHVTLPLALSSAPDDDDAFTIHIPKTTDSEDVHFVLKSIEALSSVVDVFQGMWSGLCKGSHWSEGIGEVGLLL